MESIEAKLRLARYKNFDPFYEGLLRSPPSKLAMATGRLSIGAPSFPLSKAFQSTPKAAPTELAFATDTISTLLALQQLDGRWNMDDAFLHAMHGLVPPCPPGVGSTMWATACALAALRRHPADFERLDLPCSKALTQVDAQVFEWAKQALPHIPNAANTAPKLLTALEDAAPDVVLQRKTTQVDRLSQEIQRHVESSAANALQEGYAREFKPRNLPPEPFQVGDVVECCWRQAQRANNAPCGQAEWAPARIASVDDKNKVDVVYLGGRRERLFGVDAALVRRPNAVKKAPNEVLRDLDRTWLEPLPLQDELQRVQQVVRAKTPPPWHESTNIEKQTTRTRRSRPPRRQTNAVAAATNDFFRNNDGKPLPPAHEATIAAILAYEKCLAKVSPVLKQCSRLYRSSARSFRDRIHAFDAFTPVVLELVLATVDCIERVFSFEQSLQSSTVFAPFQWHGEPFLHSVAHHADSFASCKPLQDWYGTDFHFEMNPFLLTMPLHLKQDKIQLAVVAHSWWPENRYDAALRQQIDRAEQQLLEHLARLDPCNRR
ncbi:hypothetical protein Ae201684P_002590 [Aphanomyces euteiches]|uniref:Uncharacterized protein n=1 Tax=Aphanomyces euteiches TaxID=100861 RepID=A0A6G0X587_9STRA|nr:hypothetical protein Ae201684_008323 [Aphanomyces euteiches]KAH9070223.1 hypothetical protein Ae201684P_002590 [Aphanomyces euteiches]KAH9157435.1 hypothetical protein AeRB84_000739 [Aphanomyces euteiches]